MAAYSPAVIGGRSRLAPGKAESRPARHFRTALGQVVNFFYTLQGEAAGAQAFSSFIGIFRITLIQVIQGPPMGFTRGREWPRIGAILTWVCRRGP